jgi:hypothetical protein
LKGEVSKISHFDLYEEVRFKALETSDVLMQLANFLVRQASSGKLGNASQFVTLSAESFREMRTLAQEALSRHKEESD